MFFYESSDYIKSGDYSCSLAGNAPYIVNKNTGILLETGTAHPIEAYIEKYEQEVLDKKTCNKAVDI